MDRADEIVPRMPAGQFPDPILLARQVVDFKREPDGQFRTIALRLADALNVFFELVEPHPPVVEIIRPHRRMVAEADFLQAKSGGAPGVVHRFADRVVIASEDLIKLRHESQCSRITHCP